MDRRNDDPEYQTHELKRPTRDREGPRTDSTGQEDASAADENSSRGIQQRQNASHRSPEEVRETRDEHLPGA